MTHLVPEYPGNKSGEKKNTADQKFESGPKFAISEFLHYDSSTLSLSLFISSHPGAAPFLSIGIPQPHFPDSTSGLRSWPYCHEPDLTSVRSVLDNSDLGPDCDF